MKYVLHFKIFLLIILLSGITNIFAQQNKIDSLQLILYKDLNNKELANENLEIIEEIYNYTIETQPINATQISASALHITDSLLLDSSLSIEWKNKLALAYFAQNQFGLAMDLYVEVFDYNTSTQNNLQIAYSIFNIGKIYASLNVIQIAIEKFEEAKNIFKEFSSEKKGFILTQNKIAEVYHDDYSAPADTSFQILYQNIIDCENNNDLLSITYYTIAKLYQKESEKDSALKYFELSKEKLSQNDAKGTNNVLKIAEINLLIGEVFIDADNYEDALKFINIALKEFEKLNAYTISRCHNNLGNVYFQQNKYDKAISEFNDALLNAEMFNLPIQKQEALLFLSDIYKIQGNSVKSLEYMTLYSEAIEDYFNKNTSEGFAGIIVISQNKEKQKEIELLEKEDALKSQQLKSRQQIVYGAIVLIILFLAFAIFFFYMSRKQKRSNKILQKQFNKINQQKKELEAQSKILDKATRSILRQKDELEKKTWKITSSIRYASRIQKAMLPNKTMFQQHFSEYFVFFKPKENVSGDFFWISEVAENDKPSLFQKNAPLEDKKIILAVVDCTGHGVPGAFMSMLGDAYLNQIISIQKLYEPDKILFELHKAIRHTLQQQESDNNDGMDIAICSIDKKNKTIEFAGAKNPLLYIQNDKMYRITGDLTSIGGLQKEKTRYFTKHTIDVSITTTAYMYTDGYQDQFGGKLGRKFMGKPFRQLLYDNSDKSFEEQKQTLNTSLKRWKRKKYHQMDDITVVGFKL